MTSIRVLMFCGLALMVSAVSEAGKRSKGWTQCAVSLSQGETDLGTVLGWGDLAFRDDKSPLACPLGPL